MVVGPEDIKVGEGALTTNELVPDDVILTIPPWVKPVLGVAVVDSVKLGYSPLTVMLPPLVIDTGTSGEVLLITEPEVIAIPEPFV
jgi:hypothetical protein